MSDQATELADTIPPRRFEYSDDRSYKFWTIALDGDVLITRYGKIGSQGQTRQVEFPSTDSAKREYVKRIEQKTKAGYEERKLPKKKIVTADEVWQRLHDHEPFLQAILDDPDEVAGYAIYADWLVESGDPRGEFSQLQLNLEDPSLALFRRPKVENAAKRLRQKHARRWLGNLAPWLMDYGISSYPYDFYRGQLSSISCYVLSLKFAHELRRSPYCRLLRELSIYSTEVLRESIVIDGRRFEANRDYGLETLVGADFSNMREFRIGVLPAEFASGPSEIQNTAFIADLVESMPRLELLQVRADFDLSRLLQLDLPRLNSLHTTLTLRQIPLLAHSGLLPQLQTLGILNPLSDRMIEELVKSPGFDELSEFACHEVSRISKHSKELLDSTGVVINVLSLSN